MMAGTHASFSNLLLVKVIATSETCGDRGARSASVARIETCVGPALQRDDGVGGLALRH